MKYGLPYKGSKNKLAERIVRLLPKRTNLVDLFCGGCAVSHAALVMGKYEHIHINDLNWMAPTLFIDALNGKYNNDTRWISREDFFRLRDTDPYVAVVWSFGNNMRSYLYSQEIEPLKKAIHYAIFFSDYSLGKALGHDLSFIDPIKDVQRRYVAVKRYFSQYGHFQQQSIEGGAKSATPVIRMQNGLQEEGTGRWNCATDLWKAECGLTQFGQPVLLQSWNMEQACQSDWKRQKEGSISLGISLSRKVNGWGAQPTKQAALGTATHGMYQPGVCNQKKKSASDLGKPSTESEPTALHRLQYRERQHSLPTIKGGAEFAHHKQCA